MTLQSTNQPLQKFGLVLVRGTFSSLHPRKREGSAALAMIVQEIATRKRTRWQISPFVPTLRGARQGCQASQQTSGAVPTMLIHLCDCNFKALWDY
jgi:hypothetical protein